MRTSTKRHAHATSRRCATECHATRSRRRGATKCGRCRRWRLLSSEHHVRGGELLLLLLWLPKCWWRLCASKSHSGRSEGLCASHHAARAPKRWCSSGWCLHSEWLRRRLRLRARAKREGSGGLWRRLAELKARLSPSERRWATRRWTGDGSKARRIFRLS